MSINHSRIGVTETQSNGKSPRFPLTISEWKDAQLSDDGFTRIISLIASERTANPHTHAWISLATDDHIKEQWDCLCSSSSANLPLRGVPFAVKDNINARAFRTTAACPAFASDAVIVEDAPVVAKLKAAGAILIGKTNLDQFATGLVGTRSPYGAVPNSFDPTRVSGGSSSGSAVVVARGVVPFSLGTDTAGSGRVPAGLNNIFGLKPTRGAISARGVVPACRSLDCVSIFTLTMDDAETVLSVAEGFDDEDAYSRARPSVLPSSGFGTSLRLAETRPTLAICKEPPWFGGSEQARAYETALSRCAELGWNLVPTDFDKLFGLAQLLYEGPWVAERYAAIQTFIETSASEMDPTVHSIISRAKKFSAADTFSAEYLRQDLTREIQTVFAAFDGLLVPTTPTFPTHKDIENDPVNENSKLGTYTNFVNFLDWTALAIPAGFRADGLPFGITLISDKWQEPGLLHLARQWTASETSLVDVKQIDHSSTDSRRMKIAVVGAHLKGFPLNGDLISRGATFQQLTATSAAYRLFALPGTEPKKPGIRRALVEESGCEIEVEVWSLPKPEFGEFMATIPFPLGIGSLELRDGTWVNGFVCECSALQGATDITSFGGWRAYMSNIRELSNQVPKPKSVARVLIANRGEIACRILRTLHKMNIETVAIYSDADAHAPHVRDADIALRLDGNTVADTYLNGEEILRLAESASVDAIIPGYGFLSENADFARVVEERGMVWVGPTPVQMSELGLKHRARAIAAEAGVPTVPGSSGLIGSLEDAVVEARRIGFPLMLKSTAGGGGIGLRRCTDFKSLEEAFEGVKRLAAANFADSGVFLERFIQNARHVEVQVLGDGTGRVFAAGERDCSLQRRHQKVVEEAPALMVPADVRDSMRGAAVKLASAVKYRSVGTVEFIYDSDSQEFYFLEVNTRLQVEHPITEAVTGLDLVECMIRIARQDCEGLFDKSQDDIVPSGVSVEVRVYAEDPVRSFQPCSGRISAVDFPEGLRVDTWIEVGTDVSTSYDPMLAKLIASGKDRHEVLSRLSQGLAHTRIDGVRNNLEYLRQIVSSPMFQSGSYTTRSLDTFQFISPCMQVVEPGGLITVQDFPGRTGLWSIGVPPSGPMDDFSLRLANRLVGNDEGSAGLECTLHGPSLKFYYETVVAVTGAKCPVQVDEESVGTHQTLRIRPGQVLRIGALETGYRIYVAIAGGIDVPSVMGSRATFELAKLGGLDGRKLERGDVLQLNIHSVLKPSSRTLQTAMSVPIPLQPSAHWKIGVIPGPHGVPDMFTREGIQSLFGSEWSVHYNSNRLGIRLKGTRPQWARKTGGTAGLHPSNIHDAPYSIGSVSFTGDEAIVLTADGPSLGGFVVFCVVASAELWKLGQVRPGDTIKLEPIDIERAFKLETAVLRCLADFTTPQALKGPSEKVQALEPEDVSVVVGEFSHNATKIVVRQAGDRAMLLEFGDEIAGFQIRQSLEILAFIQHHEAHPIPGVEELSPGVHTLHVKYAPQTHPKLVFSLLLEHMKSYTTSSKVQSREISLPFVSRDSITQAAVDRYSATIRSEAPWLPSNVDFLEQLNGIDDLSGVIQGSTFLVLGLGDVFLGSPCAVPLDPRHRLFGTKYNPSRSYTPRGAVGIGGQYMCIYATDSPGGYQLVGRTIDIWDPRRVQAIEMAKGGSRAPLMSTDSPWLFCLFDRIRFYRISEADLDSKPFGELVQISEGVLDVAEYEAWLVDNREDIARTAEGFTKARDSAPFLDDLVRPFEPTVHTSRIDTSEFRGERVRAPMPGRCWKVLVKDRQEVKQGEIVVCLKNTDIRGY